jgi:predicted GNAT family acetyltransferase
VVAEDVTAGRALSRDLLLARNLHRPEVRSAKTPAEALKAMVRAEEAERNVEKAAASGRFVFWTIEDRPVSVAAISRRLRHTGAIAPVYTPPEQRGRGYAGSVTAAVVDRVFAEGKTAACLYTDLRNPMSNRCYAKIGFRPHCDSWHYPRVLQAYDRNGGRY